MVVCVLLQMRCSVMLFLLSFDFFFSSRRLHTRCALVTGVQTCALPIYVNTRMLQTVLVEPKWAGRMTPEDYRGLTPLIYSHVNPYGRFDLDLNDRIDFGRLAA